MTNSYNKGEWSEFYAFLKILADGKIHAADENLHKIRDAFLSVRQVIRKEGGIRRIYGISDEVISIQRNTAGIPDIPSGPEAVPTDRIKASIPRIFKKIKYTGGASFEIPETEEILGLLGCRAIKAGSENKADIRVVIHDNVTAMDSDVGFSIKSEIGAKPTLLNASRITNFVYEIEGLGIDYRQINAIEGASKVRDRLRRIVSDGGTISFRDVNNKTFKKNLRKIDSMMPLILSEFLLCYFGGMGGKTMIELNGLVAKSPKVQGLDFDSGDIKFKMKNLLLNIALGMVPKTPWDGFLRADGGYIIVREDGEVVCYHIYNTPQFSEYLFNHTRLETASTTKHDFGTIYSEDGKLKMNLNLQIRFT